MKSCMGCKYANWDRTQSGGLHPSGGGACSYPYKVPPLPGSFYWITARAPAPVLAGINRKKALEDHCVYYAGAGR